MNAILPLLAAVLMQSTQDPPGFWEQSALLGDLGGARKVLADHGVTFTLEYTGEVQSNVSGGLRRDTAVDHLLDWVIDADFGKAVGWTGGSARINPMLLAGTGISDDVGDLTRVSNISGRGGARIFEAWLQQSVAGVASIRAGILAADQEFTISTAGLLYYNSVFGGPVFMTANFPWPIYPVGAPGVRGRVDLTKDSYLQAAVYDGDPDTEAFNRSGLRVRLRHDDGLFTIAEAAVRFGEELQGVIKVGGFLHTADFPKHSTGAPASGLGGGYVVVEQKLAPTVDVFFRAGVAQEDRALVPLGIDAGINVTGLLPGRPDDVLGIGVVYARLSRSFAQTQPDRPLWGHETVFEATYKLVLSPWLNLQPDVQLILHPGGSTATPDAVVVGLRIDVLF